MPSQNKASTPTPSTRIGRITPTRRKPFQPREYAFSAHFLDKARRREVTPGPGESMDTDLSRQARWAGPWDVETVSAGDGILHVVTRTTEPAAAGGGARLVFLRRQDALLAAATLAALATPNHLTMNTDKPSGRRSRFGYPLRDGPRHLGHITRPEDAFLAYYHAVRALTANPDAGALFIEARTPRPSPSSAAPSCAASPEDHPFRRPAPVRPGPAPVPGAP